MLFNATDNAIFLFTFLGDKIFISAMFKKTHQFLLQFLFYNQFIIEKTDTRWMLAHF